MDTIFLLTYASGNFILGILGDQFSQKKVLCLCSSGASLTYGLVLFYLDNSFELLQTAQQRRLCLDFRNSWIFTISDLADDRCNHGKRIPSQQPRQNYRTLKRKLSRRGHAGLLLFISNAFCRVWLSLNFFYFLMHFYRHQSYKLSLSS